MDLLKLKLQRILVDIVNVYFNLEDFTRVIEQKDYDGNDCLWYLMKFELFEIINCQIIDQYVQYKWNGKTNVNCSIMSYSTAYSLLNDPHGLYSGGKLYY